MNRIDSAGGSPQDSTGALPAIPPARLQWLDLFRGLAVLVMIETHVVNSFLAAGWRVGGLFAVLNHMNGLVAPSFLFIAGFVQGRERRDSPGKPINYARRSRRLLGIAALGYALHFPWVELAQHRWADALRIGSQVDVLQCLALGLGLLLGAGWLGDKCGARRGTWPALVVALAGAAVLAAPLVHGWSGGPVAVRAWINGSTGSWFPMFPWLGFIFLGALAGAWPERLTAGRMVPMAGLAAVAWACRGATYSPVSVSFFLERAVWVLGFAAVCEWNARRRWPPIVHYAGKNSLKLYVVHLMLISWLMGAGVGSSAMGWPETMATLAAVLAVSFIASRFFDRLPQVLRSIRIRENRPVPMAGDAASPAS